MNYIEAQLFRAIPFPLTKENAQDDKNGQVKIKIYTIRGESNWLNISPDQMKAIEGILNQEAAA